MNGSQKWRDLKQVLDKLQVVLLPLGDDRSDSVLERLRDWDLWGPLLVCLFLSCVLSFSAPVETASLMFAAVFVLVWFGAATVTVNAQLLGGSISFFQSVCILGYCVFPLALSALFNFLMSYVFDSVSTVFCYCLQYMLTQYFLHWAVAIYNYIQYQFASVLGLGCSFFHPFYFISNCLSLNIG